MNRNYQVYGDMQSDKSSENYPEMTLCDECVAQREVVADFGPSGEDCEDCGKPASDDTSKTSSESAERGG